MCYQRNLTRCTGEPNLSFMRFAPYILHLLLVASVALSPLAVPAGVAHAAKAEMVMGADAGDCFCCETGAAKTSAVLCCHMAAVHVEAMALPEPAAETYADGIEAMLAAATVRPDPPPPRAPQG